MLTALMTAVMSAGLSVSSGASQPAHVARPGEMRLLEDWVRALLAKDKEAAPASLVLRLTRKTLPFSFIYGSQSSSTLVPNWRQTADSRELDNIRTEHRVTYTDPKTGLEIRLESIVYKGSPAVEWVLYFTNTGASDTPILENILPLDARMAFREGDQRQATLHYAKGAVCSIDDFSPLAKVMDRGALVELQPGGGRSSSEFLPFFNIDAGSEGVVVAVGWSGEWCARFGRDQDGSLSMQAGMAKTHLKLRPGERIRTPRILVLVWEGRRFRGNNLLRRFLLTHRRPHPGGKPLVLPVLASGWGGSPVADHLKTIHRIISRNLPVGLYWIDAEWFGQKPWYKYPGNWEVRKDLYPDGFKAISGPLHRAGREFLLWFEAHRVCADTPWHAFKDRPNWLLPLKHGNPEYQQRNMNWGVPHEDPRWIIRESRRSQITEGDLLWNMGEPAARQFLADWLSERITEFGLDWYREDFNIAPLEYWREADAPDRQGMTEIRFIEGLYAMWDELLRRHPHLAIDNCASGGRRMDIETIGRSTALWRTDWPADAIHKQCHTLGLLAWVPLNMSGGAVAKKGNEYEIRSSMTAGLNVELPKEDDEEANRQAKTVIEQYLGIQRFYYGDYYPLTEYSQAKDVWTAYQLHLPEAQEGLIVVLKRPASPRNEAVLPLNDLLPEPTYTLTCLDSGQTRTLAGSALMREGVEVRLQNKPDSALIQYKRMGKP